MGARRLCFPAKKTLATVDRATLGRPEGNRSFPAALRANGGRLGPRRSGRRRSLPLELARLTALWLIFEVLVVEEVLLSRRENELCPAISALNHSILELWHLPLPRSYPGYPACPFRTLTEDEILLDLPPAFLPVSFASQRLLGPFLFAWLQIKRVPFDLFNDVLLLDFALEAAKGVF